MKHLLESLSFTANKRLITFSLLVVPLLLAIVDFFFLKAAFPLHSGSAGYDQDPAYAYLFNGLLILDGQTPHHIDHPGTPLQIIFAISIFLRWGWMKLFGDGSQSLIDSVIGQPEAYLFDVAIILLVLNLGALYFFGRRIYEASGKLVLGVFCQLSLLSFILMAPKAAYPAPEALLIFVSLCLLGLVAPQIFDQTATTQNEQQHRLARGLGLMTGLGLAVKVTFAPMVLVLLLLKKGQRRYAIGWAIISFGTLTAIASPQATRFFSWLSNIISHSGIHGSGQASVLNLSSIPANAFNLWVWFPFFCAALFCSILILIFLWLTKSSVKTKAAWLLILIALLQSVLILKHPGAHYMVPVLPIAFILMAWIYTNVKVTSPWLRQTGVVITLLFVVHSMALTTRGIQKLTLQREEMTVAMADINKILTQHPDAIVICSFRCALPQYALSMALIFAPGLITDKTTASLRNFYDFDIFVSQLISPIYQPQSISNVLSILPPSQTIFLVTPQLYPQLKDLKIKPLGLYTAQSIYYVFRHD